MEKGDFAELNKPSHSGRSPVDEFFYSDSWPVALSAPSPPTRGWLNRSRLFVCGQAFVEGPAGRSFIGGVTAQPPNRENLHGRMEKGDFAELKI